ncbi:MAG: hypothetical protein M1834_001376 [Cirrosporium novae-zelandiae]|nr:MAG: hypothetical protein M1834_001376 [Cirrosporium novae-zelandiae]
MTSEKSENDIGVDGSTSKDVDVLSIETASEDIQEDTIDEIQNAERGLSPQISPVSWNLTEPPLSRKATSIGTAGTSNPNFEIDFDDNDPLNPHNWSIWYKGLTLGFVSFSTLVVVIYSTSYSSGIAQMMEEFNVSSEPVVTLGMTTYLMGLALGSVTLAPLSETYGRRPVYIISMAIFVVLFIPCGIGSSLAEVLVVRFFGAFAGSAMIANAPGTVSDVSTEKYRALAFSIWSIGPLNGPVFGPIIGGFVTEYLGWRWTNWIVMILSGVAFVFMCIVEETYAPAILQKKARQRREETGDERWWCRYDQRVGLAERLRVNLSRPFIMMVTEPICIFWDAYISVVYGLLYLCFVAYPIVFTGIRGWSTGISGLAFVGIGMGSLISIILEPVYRRIIKSHKPDPMTGHATPEAMVSIVCIATILLPVGQLWFAWTSVPKTIHWIAPILAGIPFGMGNTAVFIYATNYLAHSYGVYAASALAGNSVIRSMFGATLPLAGPSMYSVMGPRWAGTFLGLLEVLIIPIPFAFYKYGHRIRMKSGLIQKMQDDRRRLEVKEKMTPREGEP